MWWVLKVAFNDFLRGQKCGSQNNVMMNKEVRSDLWFVCMFVCV